MTWPVHLVSVGCRVSRFLMRIHSEPCRLTPRHGFGPSGFRCFFGLSIGLGVAMFVAESELAPLLSAAIACISVVIVFVAARRMPLRYVLPAISSMKKVRSEEYTFSDLHTYFALLIALYCCVGWVSQLSILWTVEACDVLVQEFMTLGQGRGVEDWLVGTILGLFTNPTLMSLLIIDGLVFLALIWTQRYSRYSRARDRVAETYRRHTIKFSLRSQEESMRSVCVGFGGGLSLGLAVFPVLFLNAWSLGGRGPQFRPAGPTGTSNGVGTLDEVLELVGSSVYSLPLWVPFLDWGSSPQLVFVGSLLVFPSWVVLVLAVPRLLKGALATRRALSRFFMLSCCFSGVCQLVSPSANPLTMRLVGLFDHVAPDELLFVVRWLFTIMVFAVFLTIGIWHHFLAQEGRYGPS